MDRRIILFELNEVPFRIVDQFRQWNPKSALARHLGECRQYETYTEDIGHLSPWKTWPTLHRGVTNDRHMIADFGQDLKEVDKEFPPLWKILARNGVSTGVCGSLHTYPMPEDPAGYAFYLPDTFAAGSECFPNELSLFQEFNLTMARESARNVSTKVPWQSTLRMLRSAPELGLRFRTFLDIGKQLVDERLRSWKKSRRRTYQAVLAFDIFMRQLEKTRPRFSTFFTNHVAAAQHRYWAAAFPGDYQHMGYDAKWVDTYSHEIQFGMEKFDAFFARLIAYCNANPEYVLWVVTSMGQAATEAKPLETQLYLVDSDKFTTALGLEKGDWTLRPAMLPQWNAIVLPHRIADFREKLDRLSIAGIPLGYRVAEGGFFSLDFGHCNLYEQTSHATLDGKAVSLEDLGLKNVEIEDKSNATAYHIPQGVLLTYDPRDRAPKDAGRVQVSTAELAPTILRNYNVEPPAHMRRPVSVMTN